MGKFGRNGLLLLGISCVAAALFLATDGTAANEEKKGGVSHPWIGVQLRPADEVLRAQLGLDGGLVVDQVVPDAPADKAGLKRHDVIVAIGDGQPGAVPDVVKAVKESEGKPLNLEVFRRGKKKTIEVTPVQRPKDFAAPKGNVERFEGLDRLPPEIRKMLKGFDPEDLEKHLKEHGTWGMKDGQPWHFRFGGPGKADRKTPTLIEPLADNVAIKVTKQGEGPAKVEVTIGEETYKTTADKLDELPEEVRPHVKRLLGQDRLGIDLDFDLAPMLRKFDLPRLPELPLDTPQKLDDFQRSMDQRIEDMQEQLRSLQEEIQRFRGSGDAAEDAPAA